MKKQLFSSTYAHSSVSDPQQLTGCLHTVHGETTLPSFSASVIGFLKRTVYLLEIIVLFGVLKINQYDYKILMCVEEA